jgi:hypothetical protein
MAYKRISPIPIVEGGTGAQTLGLNGVLIGNTLSAITTTTAGTTGQILTGVTGLPPTFQSPAASVTSIAGTANQITASASTGSVTLSTPSTFIAPGSIAATTTVTATLGNITATSGTLVVSSPVTVANGGTGATTLASDGVLYGNGTSVIGATTAGTNGQVLLGATSAAPAFATLTSTGGSLTYTTGANALNIDIANYVSTTWTPVLKFGGGTTGITYNVQAGAYSRVGNILTMCMEIALSAVGSSTGNATITGLTQSVATSNTSVSIFAAGVFSLSGVIDAYYDGTNINLYQISTSGTATPLTNAAFSSSSQLIISASWVV